jgi:hypothetical protein
MLPDDEQAFAEQEAMIEVEEAERALELAQLRLVAVVNHSRRRRHLRVIVPDRAEAEAGIVGTEPLGHRH